ncbi:hypothetical protein V8E55_005788 [Tylopilus felleus]
MWIYPCISLMILYQYIFVVLQTSMSAVDTHPENARVMKVHRKLSSRFTSHTTLALMTSTGSDISILVLVVQVEEPFYVDHQIVEYDAVQPRN